jgi:predicted pyridoxine 5'-phosphate oxidase superfamily flavin-nucleotide-binding protein
LIITGFGYCSPQTDHVATGTARTTLKSEEPDYRKLVNTPDLAAIVTVDKDAGRILGVRFRNRS